MKTFVPLLVVGLLSLSSASLSPEEAKAEVVAHVEPQIFSLLSQPGVARAGGGIKCYDKYIPLITAATENSKTDTEACIARAASRREDELNKVKAERESLDTQVHKVEETLSLCLNKTDDLEYLKCLKENSQNLQNALDEVGKTSSTLSDNLSVSYKNIDTTEDTCIKAVISKSKSVSDELLAALQNCLMNGLDDGSEGGSDAGSDGGSDAGSDNGSDNGGSENVSDNGSDGGSDNGENGGSDAGSDGGSNGDAENGSDGGSDAGDDNGNENGSDNGADSNPEGGADSGNDNGSEGGSEGDSDSGADSGSDSGVVPNPDTLPEEDLTP